MNQVELIRFEAFGMQLQEPMALITNWMIASFCFFAFFRLKTINEETGWWKQFFLFMGISTLLGGLSHLFFQYFDVFGKFPNWTTGIMCGYFAGKAMICRLRSVQVKKFWNIFLISKAVILLLLALSYHNFVFVAVDAIVTYLMFCGVMAFILYRRGFSELRFMVYGVLVCLPSAFIFLLKINPHRWLNKDDLSHLFMLGCIIYFYLGAKRIKSETSF